MRRDPAHTEVSWPGPGYAMNYEVCEKRTTKAWEITTPRPWYMMDRQALVDNLYGPIHAKNWESSQALVQSHRNLQVW
jgi:hypothetical protein